ncbi:TPA: restriction endonuclease subunit S [Streptococcus suis]
MSKLEECILGDLVEFQRGYDLPKSKFVEGKYPVQSSNGILGYHNEYKVEGPGITIGRSGTVGTPHLIRENFFPHNTSLFVKEFKGNDIEYIYYLLQYLDLGNQKSGSGVPTMNRNHLHPIKIRAYRDKTYQQRTIKILSLIDKKIQINNQINQELEAMAKTLYDYWFVQFDFPDENGKPYKSSGGKMVYNDQLKREIPEGWGVDSLWNIATFYNGLAMQKFRPASETDECLPVIKIREMFSGFSKDTEKASTTIPKEAIIEAGDILFSWSATLEVILWGGEKGALNQHIFKVTSEKYPKSFIYNELRSYLKVFKTIAELRKTTMGHITQDHLKQAMIIVPPNDLIDEIHNRISHILKQQLDLKQQNQELTQLRDWLLPMLMNGQVKVD